MTTIPARKLHAVLDAAIAYEHHFEDNEDEVLAKTTDRMGRAPTDADVAHLTATEARVVRAAWAKNTAEDFDAASAELTEAVDALVQARIAAQIHKPRRSRRVPLD